MERLIPDAGLVVFEGAGHFSYADQPRRFTTIVTHFLTQTATRTPGAVSASAVR